MSALNCDCATPSNYFDYIEKVEPLFSLKPLQNVASLIEKFSKALKKFAETTNRPFSAITMSKFMIFTESVCIRIHGLNIRI